MISHYTVIKTMFMYFVYDSLGLRMVADVTETRNVIPSLEFKTCMTIKRELRELEVYFRKIPQHQQKSFGGLGSF